MEYTKSKNENHTPFRQEKGKAEKIATMILFGIILSIFFFIVFSGPLSKRTLGSLEEGFSVQTKSLLRYKRAFPMEILIKPVSFEKDYRISINKCYLKTMNIIKISPEPRITLIGENDYIFSFDLPNHPSNNKITFFMKPITTGNARLVIGQENGISKEMNVFICP